jgi:hypothetical protein
MPPVVDVKVFPVCIVDAIELTLVCFWIELLQFLVRQNMSNVYMSFALWRVVFKVTVENMFLKCYLLWISYN